MKRLTANFELLTDAEKRVCSYIVEHPQEVIELTINDLAERSHTSKTVVVNTAQKLQFAGYADLKYNLRDTMDKMDEAIEARETKNQILELSTMTAEIVNIARIQEVAHRIHSAKTVYIAARGTSKAVASHLNHLLLTMGIKCLLIEDYNLLTLITDNISRDEMLILISLSGETRKIIEMAKITKSRGVFLVSLTSFRQSTLTDLADLNLYAVANSMDTLENDDISRIGFFMIAEILAHEVKSMGE